VHRPAEKTVAHQGQDGLAQWVVDDASVEGVEPCLAQGSHWSGRLPKPGIAKRRLVDFTIVASVHGASPGCEIFETNYSQLPSRVNKKIVLNGRI
jgi:hypothetical protein